jgi:hypothetical protein
MDVHGHSGMKYKSPPMRRYRLSLWLMPLCYATLTVSALEFTRGPFVQNATPNSIQILWQTSEPALARVEYGPTPALGLSVILEDWDAHRLCTLQPLIPDTRYYYRIANRTDSSDCTSSIESFNTLKTKGAISFAVISDTAQTDVSLGVPPQRLLADVLGQRSVDLVLHLGDIVARDFNPTNVQTQFFDVFQPVIKHTPFYLAIGNHDLFPGPGELVDPAAPGFHQAFSLPTNSMDGTSRYYSFDHGDVHFVCLFNPWFAAYNFNPLTDQYRWLTNDLAVSTKPWKLLFFHAPVATSSLHAFDDYNGNEIPDPLEMLYFIAPLARRLGVQMVFNGHDHSLHRYPPSQGLHFCVTAGGGQGIYPFVYPFAGLAKYWETHHCLRIGVTNDTMTLEAFDTSGTKFDAWTVQKDLPPRQFYQASWHTPAMAASVANDDDGNVSGQTFDFAGVPIHPRAGEFSNLGLVYVNYDQTNLYVGFRQVMIQSYQNIFLFIDSPRSPGVATMAGLGNGIIDPDGEGADGLDCLENLSFTNFTPSIGCLLGDEFADQNLRSFARTNLGLNIGQGVFRLDKQLSEVPGSRLQQFNLSPQLNAFQISWHSTMLEQNADLIQIAIPLSELGNPQPEDPIKLGAVVGDPMFDINRQTRRLDTSVLGWSLTGAYTVVLEGLTVQLAPAPAQDSDQDGLFDWQELIAGTDTHDPRSALRLKALPFSRHRLLLSWQAVPGKRYLLETADHLQAEFVSMNEPTFPRTATSTNEIHIIRRLENTSTSAAFYRIRLLTD